MATGIITPNTTDSWTLSGTKRNVIKSLVQEYF